jgi:hypothetical protein
MVWLGTSVAALFVQAPAVSPCMRSEQGEKKCAYYVHASNIEALQYQQFFVRVLVNRHLLLQ